MNTPIYDMVFRCEYCNWFTLRYSDIDEHEYQVEPGHYVTGHMENINRLEGDNYEDAHG